MAALISKSHASRRCLILVVAAILVSCVSYGSVRVLWVLGRAGVGFSNGSKSEADSKSAGFYLGTYVPSQRRVSLSDGTLINVPDAWMERAWKPHLTLLLQDRRVPADGYYLYIPIYPAASTRSNTIWPLKFSVHLDEVDRQVSRYPGVSFNPELGFHVFLDSPAQTVKFIVEQKEHENDTWDRAVPVSTDRIQARILNNPLKTSRSVRTVRIA